MSSKPETPQSTNAGLEIKLKACEVGPDQIKAEIVGLAARLGVKITEGQGGMSDLASLMRRFDGLRFDDGDEVTVRASYDPYAGESKLFFSCSFRNPNFDMTRLDQAQSTFFGVHLGCESLDEGERSSEPKVVVIGSQGTVAGFASVIASNVPGKGNDAGYRTRLEEVIAPHCQNRMDFAVLKVGDRNILLISECFENGLVAVQEMLDLDDLDETVNETRRRIWAGFWDWLQGGGN